MRRAALLVPLLLPLAPAVPARLAAQAPVAVEALVDVEAWKTDTLSRLLARNGGDPAFTARVHLWASWRPLASLEVVALGVGDVGNALSPSTDPEPVEVYGGIELLGVRWTPSPRLAVEAGKVLMPLGAFGRRHFSDVNPLIGAPDMYPTQYPWGAVVTAVAGPFDARAAVVSQPAVNTRYTPVPGHRLRPLGGVGVRLGPYARVGVGATRGPYLGPRYAAQLPAGTAWTDLAQTVVAADARVSAGRVELYGEAAYAEYEAPTRAAPLIGRGWYADARVTLTPRLFAAARYEHYPYPFIRPVSAAFWVGNVTTQRNGEVGAGYRFTPSALLKLSFRKDDWPHPRPTGGPPIGNGYAVAAQLSWRVNVADLFQPRF